MLKLHTTFPAAWRGAVLVLLAALALCLAVSHAAFLDEAKKLVASDPRADDGFGFSVSASNDMALVGSYLEDAAGTDAGAAYVFRRDQGGTGNWGQVKKLTGADTEGSDLFGVSVAVSGDTAVIGASGEDMGGNEAGAAYIFQRDLGGANNWGQVKKLTSSDILEFHSFGTSVAIDDDTVVIGALGEDSNGSYAGAAYVFQRNQGGSNNWGEVKKLTASDPEEFDFFGNTVSVQGDTAVIGAEGEDALGGEAGAAYVFHRNEGGVDNWGELKKLTASDGAALDGFGSDVTVSSDLVIVGAVGEDAGGGEAGAAYVYQRDTGGANNWGEVKKLMASDAGADDGFGASVALSGNAVVVGATLGDATSGDEGSAYVFQRNAGGNGNWGQVKKLTASDAAPDDGFGAAVGFNGETAVLGASGEDAGGGEAGAAYVFGETDTDGDGVKDLTDNCPNAINAGQQNAVHPATFAGDHCENPDGDLVPDVSDSCPDDVNNDSDADGVCVAAGFQPPKTAGNDNCPHWANPSQSLPAWSVPAGDPDCDGFPDSVTVAPRGRENFIGTDTIDHCADSTTPNNERGPAFGEPLSPWPPDFNDNQLVNLSDIVAMGPSFNTPGPPRFNLNAVAGISLSDVVVMGPFFNKSCA